jgi:NADH:ubiquinone oxidoreductase subunit F (NADH-binding)
VTAPALAPGQNPGPGSLHPGHAAVPGEAGLPRLLPETAALPGAPAVPGRGPDLRAHLRRHGLPRYRGSALTGQAEAAGLTGRGGAAFPMARKLRAVASSGAVPVVVGNGAEGEPGSSKDAALLWFAPHLVLDGLQLAAEAAGSDTAWLCLPAARAPGQAGLAGHLRAALAERQPAGTERVLVQLAEAPPRFLAGQESALVTRLNGGAARPAYSRHRVFERGVGGRPTLVQNVETLAHLALIARHGAAWFGSVGTPGERGSMLCTIREAGGRVRITEAALGTPLPRLLRLGDDVQAVLAGGYHGGWLDTATARRLTLCDSDLRAAGAMTGAGVLIALPAGCCGLAETASVARFLALESAGQCGPCHSGLPAIAAALARVARPRAAPQELAALRRWTGLMAGRGACHHPDGTVRFVRTALAVFEPEIAEHDAGRCTATRPGPFLPLAASPRTESDWR